jgi:hypothetical protein
VVHPGSGACTSHIRGVGPNERTRGGRTRTCHGCGLWRMRLTQHKSRNKIGMPTTITTKVAAWIGSSLSQPMVKRRWCRVWYGGAGLEGDRTRPPMRGSSGGAAACRRPSGEAVNVALVRLILVCSVRVRRVPAAGLPQQNHPGHPGRPEVCKAAPDSGLCVAGATNGGRSILWQPRGRCAGSAVAAHRCAMAPPRSFASYGRRGCAGHSGHRLSSQDDVEEWMSSNS